MLKNMTPRERKTDIYYELMFDDGHCNGFGFPCDADGNVLPFENPAAAENLKWCFENPSQFSRYAEVVPFRQTYTEPASGDCSCGERVFLTDEYYGACECPKCGKWYNLFGQEILPPDKWETDPSEEEW